MGFRGFYKGEKKKSKKGQESKKNVSTSPVITFPEIISKKKKES